MSEPNLHLSTTQTVAVGSSSAATANAFHSETFTVRVVSTADAHIAFGTSPTATADNLILPANTVEFFKISAPGTTKLAALKVSGNGTLRVTEMTV